VKSFVIFAVFVSFISQRNEMLKLDLLPVGLGLSFKKVNISSFLNGEGVQLVQVSMFYIF
jgi:hypothetical protein